MKYAWKTLTVLMIASPCHVLADANTPTDDVVKQQFVWGGVLFCIGKGRNETSATPETARL